MLNVLTILTFIGSGLGYILSCYGFFSNTDPDKQIEKIREAQEKMDASSFGGKIMEGSIEMIQKSYDNRYLLLISNLIFITLCVIGAIRMRKLRKSGYFFYLTGELAPLVLMAGLFGTSFFAAFNLLFGALIAVIFVILYSTQLKYMENK